MSPTDTLEDQKLQEFTRSLAGKSKAEAATLIKEFAEKNCDVRFDEKVVAHLTDDQVRMIVTGATEDAKRVAEDAAQQVEIRYGLTPSESKSVADKAVSNTMERQRHQHRDFQEAAKVLQALAKTATGRARAGELQEAYDREHEYLVKTGRGDREERAMSIGTDSSGGYLGGEIFSTMLYDNISRYSYGRKYATILQMEREVLRLPTLTATFTATQDSEAATISASQWTQSQFVLNTKKITVLSKPFSVELLEVADPSLVPTIIEFATREITKKEDGLIFGTSSPGLLSQSTNNVNLGGDGTSSTSGATSITQATFDDMINLIYKLDTHYIPDDDVQGSGMFTSGAARFWVPQSLVQTLALQKGNDQYYWANVQQLKHDKQIHGFDVKRVPAMANAPAAGVRCAAFGDLGRMVCGVRPGYRIELQSQGTVDSVSLNETNSYALRITEFFDCDSIDDSGFSVLVTAAS